jgi:hypothetical protein
MKRWAAIAAMLLGLLGVAVAPAYADPTNAPNSLTFPITCDGTTYTVVGVPGQGQWTPALATDGTTVLVPFAFDVTFTDLVTGETFSNVVTKQAANHLPTVDCTFTIETIDPETGHAVTIEGTAAGFVTPRGG